MTSALREMIERWRNPHGYDRRTVHQCADELEAALATPDAGDGWREVQSDEVDEAGDHDWIWIRWDNGRTDLSEGWACIQWSDATHWMPAKIQTPPPPSPKEGE